ncbi:MAG: hypothetical protein GC184_10900 [Rhizobiales bacterium]|nr:hypothetical protein [Hyphomicrobiales bacterium]
MTFKNILLAGTALGAAALFTGPAMAGSSYENDAVKAQLEALQQQIDDMKVQYGNELKDIKERQDAVQVTMKNGRPTFKTGDGLFELSIQGRAHLDTGMYSQSSSDKALTGGRQGNINFRRAILGVSGTFMKDWGYDLFFNFGDSGNEQSGVIYEAALHYEGIDGIKISLGAIQPKMTLDDSTSSNDITFIERATAANLATSFGAGDGRMAIGVTGHTDNFFAAGYYTMNSVGSTADYDTSNLVGRVAVAFEPMEGATLHLGASGTYSMNIPNQTMRLRDRPELRVDPTRYIDTGNLTDVDKAYTYGPEAAFATGPFRVQGEYYVYELDRTANPDPSFNAWYAQASWIVTGEAYKYDIKKAAFKGVSPANPFVAGGGIGAVELAVRYSSADLTDGTVVGGEQDIWTGGINWYPNKNVRFMLEYLNVDVNQGALNYGHDAVALRTQFTF